MRHLLWALIWVTCSASAGEFDVCLAWDASETPECDSYQVYAHTSAITLDNYRESAVICNTGTNLTTCVTCPATGTWYFVVTAWKYGLESDLSNTVTAEVPLRPPDPPQVPPLGPRSLQVIVQHSYDLTNFNSIGFFRLVIQPP